jgi:hypothetical protein
MPQSTHDRAAELHNLASHAHTAAATGHGKGDHLTDHELSKQAREHSLNAQKHAEELLTKAGDPRRAQPDPAVAHPSEPPALITSRGKSAGSSSKSS